MQNIQAESALISQDLKTTSLIVAEKFGKQHRDVLKTIRNLGVPDEYYVRNFAHIDVFRHSQLNGSKISSKAYEMTRDGFALLVMGFTGKKAMEWKIKFLQAFNKMEQQLKSQPKRLPGRPPRLSGQDVLDIVEMSKKGLPRAKIAKDMRCTYAHITAILNGKTRSDITGIHQGFSFASDSPPVLSLPAPTIAGIPSEFPKQRTMGGSYFNPFDFNAKCIYIGDIAHTLSNLCCFIGHTDTFHSIADHCINLSRQFKKFTPELRLQALLYHSPAAYLGPLTSGLRERLPELKKWEGEIRSVVFSSHGIKTEPTPLSILSANKQVLAQTGKEMMGVEDDEILEGWGIIPPSGRTDFFHSRTNAESCTAFLAEFDSLGRLLGKQNHLYSLRRS